MSKPGYRQVSIHVPEENLQRLARLPWPNRTTSVNKAITMYLDVQGPDKNRYGVDCQYMKTRMHRLMRDMGDFTPEEMARELKGMIDVLV